jgi:hypothetical protein
MTYMFKYTERDCRYESFDNHSIFRKRAICLTPFLLFELLGENDFVDYNSFLIFGRYEANKNYRMST